MYNTVGQIIENLRLIWEFIRKTDNRMDMKINWITEGSLYSMGKLDDPNGGITSTESTTVFKKLKPLYFKT